METDCDVDERHYWIVGRGGLADAQDVYADELITEGRRTW